MKHLSILILCFILIGCAAGGALYEQKRYDPTTGNLILLTKVHSARGLEKGHFTLDANGTIDANVTGLTPGPSTISELQQSIGELVMQYLGKVS